EGLENYEVSYREGDGYIVKEGGCGPRYIKREELEIGEILNYEGIKLRVEEAHKKGCWNCYFKSSRYFYGCVLHICRHDVRKDKKQVNFVLIK
ncbi:MAG: hypothetical protein ACRC0V_00175, partial [Fusobacteriaceae bacterium]